jgi:DNA-directed RNA polymerase subunit beta
MGPGYLHDGLTGDRFDQPVTVGVIYMLKLGHLTTRCTPVPSGRTCSSRSSRWVVRRSFGQRFGEMEVWA